MEAGPVDPVRPEVGNGFSCCRSRSRVRSLGRTAANSGDTILRISRRSRCDLTGTSTRQPLVRFYEILPRLKDQTGTAFESALKGQQGL
jgi:hypothetical protein